MKKNGFVLDRTTKHQIWKHPDGRTIPASSSSINPCVARRMVKENRLVGAPFGWSERAEKADAKAKAAEEKLEAWKEQLKVAQEKIDEENRQREAEEKERAERKKNKKPRFQGLRNVRAEMRRVTWPTRQDVIRWSLVVIFALIFFTLFVVVLDNFIVTPILYFISGFAPAA